MPSDAKAELEEIGFDILSEQVGIHLLNDLLEERQVNSAPKWWELNFFEAGFDGLWDFFVDQCRNNFQNDENMRELFDYDLASYA